MQAIVKELLSLTKSADAAKWAAIEQKVLQNIASFSAPEISKVSYHFGDSGKGTE
jgi:hypothetical protein